MTGKSTESSFCGKQMCFSQTRKTTIYCKLHFPKLAKKIVLIPNVLIECCIDHSEHEIYSCYSQM